MNKLAPLAILLFAAPATFAQTGFTKHILSSDFISEGVAVADVNNDGHTDIIAGAYWFEAPDWTRHELAPGKTYRPDTQFSNSFLNFTMDVDQDGWTDLVRFSLPGEEVAWYHNPGKQGGYWPMHLLLQHAGNESPTLTDIDGDGRPDILCNDWVAKEMIWLQSPTIKGDTTWQRHVISNTGISTNRYTHGLGTADMNGDGRKDILITKGWWETPADRTQTNWTFHAADLGEDCSQIYALDAHNLVSASAHKYGIWWHQQKNDTAWEHHVIYNQFSQSHGLAMADINNDGHPDLVTGKRYFAHNHEDPGAFDPAVLYWFEYRPGATPSWIPHLVDDNSGVGLQVVVQDINKDGLPDIIVSNKKGVFFFEQK
ncbi:FG-GAP-like repeat-containing protein [Deminuibacter soli]|nr:FG-GAP-like repeat-containing protein [Deminuibacter soli]